MEPVVRADEDDYELVHRIYRESVLIASAYRSRITHELIEISKELGLPSAVKFSQYDILCELFHHPGDATPSSIARRTRLKLPNVSSAIAELCDLGLVERDTDGGDRRKSIVHLTPLGERFGDLVVRRCSGISEALFRTRPETEALLAHYAAIERAI